jgi:hypothetical protein
MEWYRGAERFARRARVLVELAPGTGYETNPANVKRPELQFILDHWNAIRGERAMPSRADIVLRDLKAQLGWISLIDVLPDTDDFRYRLIGTRIIRYFRGDTTGKTVTESFVLVPEAGAMMLALLRSVVQNRLVVRSFGNLAWMGNDFEDFESLFLPFSDDGTAVTMIMNPFVYDTAQALRSGSRL